MTNWKKNTILFLSSQAISFFGSMLVQYAITWYITLQTKSGTMMTISIICGFLPTLFITPFSGVWADRYNRKILIALSDSLIALSTLVLAIVFLMGYKSMWLLFLVSGIRSLGSGVQTPAVGAFLPGIVPEDKLTRVNGINSSIQSLIMIVSPMLSGALLAVASIESVFFVDVITAAIAVSIVLLFLNVPIHAKALEKQKVSYFTDMVEGIKYIKNHDFVRTIFIFNSFFFVLVGPVAFLTPLQVTRSFGGDVWRLTATEIAFSSGMTLGGLLIASWGGFKNRLHTMVLSNFVISASTVALGAVPNFIIYLSFMVIAGIAMPIFNTPFTVLLQQKVEQDFLGRVFGVLGMISSSVMPLSMLFYGPIADLIKIEWLLLITGALMFVLSFLMMRNKTLFEAGKPISD